MSGGGSKKREKTRKDSLDVLARIASESQGPPVNPAPPKREAPSRKTPASGSPKPRPEPRHRPLEGRAAEEADRRAWQARREREVREAQRLAGSAGTGAPQAPGAPATTERQQRARARAEERRMRRESLRELQDQRKQALLRGGRLERRGPWMSEPDVPTGVRASRFDVPPSLHDKITGVLGDEEPPKRESARERERKRQRK